MGDLKDYPSSIRRKSDRQRVIRKLKGLLPAELDTATLQYVQNLSLEEQREAGYEALLNNVVSLMNVPDGVDPDEYSIQINAELRHVVGQATASAEGMADWFLHGMRPEVCAAIAWNQFRAAKKSKDLEEVLQFMTVGALYYGTSCAAQLDRSIEAKQREGALAMQRNSEAAQKSLQAKAEAIKLWPKANRKGWTAERLWTELTNKGQTIKADTVRKWMTKLRQTGTC